MSSQGPRLRADSRSPVRYASIQRQLRRFPPDMRPPIFAVARQHIRLAELSLSYPALLAALAYPRACADRRPLMEMVIKGVPLPVVAEVARVPFWLRRMPPHLLVAPLPALPDSAFLRHRLVNHFPHHPAQSADWFGAVAKAGLWVDEDFTVWCARHYAFAPPKLRGRRRRGRNGVSFFLLCLWAWYSGRPDTRAYNLMATRWVSDMEMGAACSAAYDWRESLELEFALGARRIDDNWLQPGSVDGYSFTPLCSAAEIDAEGRAMRNCLRTYGDYVATGDSRLWSVRRDGARIATLEIGRMGRNPLPVVRQLRLSENLEPPADLWLSVNRWFQTQEIPHFPTPPPENTLAPLDRCTWQQLWKPYWLAKRRIPTWLPLSPSMDAL